MTPTEVAALLAICASFDNRKPSPETVQAWTAAIGDLDYVAARTAVVRHYQTTADWIMPSHIRTAVRRERASRIEDAVVPMPPGLDPDDTGAYVRVLREGRRALADGRSLPPTPSPVPGHAERLRALLGRQSGRPEGLAPIAHEPQPTADDQTEAECQPNREAS